MTNYVIVNIGDLIDSSFKSTMDAFVDEIMAQKPDSGLLENDTANPSGKKLKDEVLKAFLQDLVAKFRIGEIDADAFRNRTCALFDLDRSKLSDQAFDAIWCKMCPDLPVHATRVQRLLSRQDITVILHSGTNSIHQEYIVKSLSGRGVQLPPTVYLSYEKHCAYDNKDNNLIKCIFSGIKIAPDDHVTVMVGTPLRDQPDFQNVAVKRDHDIKENTKVYCPHASILFLNKAMPDPFVVLDTSVTSNPLYYMNEHIQSGPSSSVSQRVQHNTNRPS